MRYDTYETGCADARFVVHRLTTQNAAETTLIEVACDILHANGEELSPSTGVTRSSSFDGFRSVQLGFHDAELLFVQLTATLVGVIRDLDIPEPELESRS